MELTIRIPTFELDVQVITYKRGTLLFAFNFHHKNFYEVYRVGVPEAGEFKVGEQSWL